MSSKAYHESNNPKAKKAAGTRPAWKLFAIPAALIILVIVVACALLLPTLRGDQGTAQKLMSKYYTNLYATGGDISLLSECLPLELRDSFEQVSTMGGVSTSIFVTYRAQMKELCGDNTKVTVKIKSSENAGSAKLAAMQKEFYDVSTVTDIVFVVSITGDTGTQEMEGETSIVSIGGQLYLSTYNLVLNKAA